MCLRLPTIKPVQLKVIMNKSLLLLLGMCACSSAPTPGDCFMFNANSNVYARIYAITGDDVLYTHSDGTRASDNIRSQEEFMRLYSPIACSGYFRRILGR